MLKQLLPAIRATLVIALLTGVAFPLAVTVLSNLLFKDQANGSLVKNDKGEVIGSKLIAQSFARAEYFHPRPSAAGAGYAAEASAGSNLGPTSKKLFEGQSDDPATPTNESFAGVKQLSESFRQENHLAENEKVPVEAVSRSGSGLDPHISYANALFQSRRVSQARGLSVEQVKQIVEKNIEGRQLGFLGEPRINVLQLNLALDQLKR